MLIIRLGERLAASVSLDLDRREMTGLFVSPSQQNNGLGRKLVTSVEKLATRYGLLRLDVCAAEPAIDFYLSCGYRAVPGACTQPDPRSGMSSLKMFRIFNRRQTRFGRRIGGLHRHLGINQDYGVCHRLRLQEECQNLVSIGQDIFAREQRLSATAGLAWSTMQSAAAAAGVELQTVSAYRSVEYQSAIINSKLDSGQVMSRILEVSAAPGYSEHHGGNALDLTTSGFEPLEQEFEQSHAFKWLCKSAGRHGFHMSYPRENRHGVAYEPWHWCWRK